MFVELKRRSFELYYHRNKRECDFLVKAGTKIIQAIQVCSDITSWNENREIEGLYEAMEQYNLKDGLLLSTDQEEIRSIKNKTIHIMPTWKWILKNK